MAPPALQTSPAPAPPPWVLGQRPPGECVRRPDFYLRMAFWGEAHDGGRYRFYDSVASLMLLARGASYARLPSPSERSALRGQLEPLVTRRLRELGGEPETYGVCVAAPDFSPPEEVEYRRDPGRFRPGAFSAEEESELAAHTRDYLRPGRYCHSSALDRRPWSDLHVSPLELQETLAQDVLRGRRVLVLRGADDNQPSDSALQPVLRSAATAALLPLAASATADVPALEKLLGELTSQVLPAFDVLLLVGLPPGVGALLALEVGCTLPSLQAIDAGDLHLQSPRGLPQQPLVMRTQLQAASSSAEQLARDPRPQLQRATGEFLELNGDWELLITPEDTNLAGLPAGPWPEVIKVPMAPQAHLGRATKISPHEVVWYRRRLRLPEAWCAEAGGSIHLRIDACDWDCRFFLDGKLLGQHRGAYDPFELTLDLVGSGACSPGGAELVVSAWDPTDAGCEYADNPPIPCVACCDSGWQPRGKQSLRPGFIMYTGVSGLWRQGVWVERRPRCHLARAEAEAAGAGKVLLRAQASCSGGHLAAGLRLRGAEEVFATAEGACCSLEVPLKEPLQPWSPESPATYEAVLVLDGGADVVVVSLAARTVAVSEGRVLLNGQPLFMHGVLYQGYWPESLMTPPAPAAVLQDLEDIKAAGFNTVRVHAIVMGAAFYAICDLLGLLVWQDMPSGDGRAMPVWEGRRGQAEEEHFAAGGTGTGIFDEIRRSPESEAVFDLELQAMVSWLMPFPCILVWVLFNEGWGQSRTAARVQWLRQADPSRLVNAASGWNEVAEAEEALGDFADLHNYEDSSSPFGPLPGSFSTWPLRLGRRVKALGEYGGLGYALEGHEWMSQRETWGYGGVHADAASYRTAMERLYNRLLPLVCGGGLSAAIYTQWMDVESEVNGLLTYDRLPKLPLEVLRSYSSALLGAWRQCLDAS